MLLNFNELQAGGYQLAVVYSHENFVSELNHMCQKVNALPVVVNQIESQGVMVEGRKVYLDFDNYNMLCYLNYCVQFIQNHHLIDFEDFRDFIDFWYEEGFTHPRYKRGGLHTIKFDNYEECSKFYAVVFYIAELHTEFYREA